MLSSRIDTAFLLRFSDTNAYILPLLVPISNDFEPAVRRHFMEQLAILAKVGSHFIISHSLVYLLFSLKLTVLLIVFW